LDLQIGPFTVKPANMKTIPSGTLRVGALVGVGLVTVIILRALAQSPADKPDQDIDKIVLKIAKKGGDYYPLKDTSCDGENKFIELLNGPAYDKGYKMHFKHKDPLQPECDLPGDCAPCKKSASPAQLKIKTDKVTVSERAKEIETGEVTPVGDPNVTIRIVARNAEDINAVLAQLAPSP
jgi:hypothetical protein